MRYLKLFENFSQSDSLEELEKKMDEILENKEKNKGNKENTKLASLVVKKCREKYPSPHYITTSGRPDPKDTTNKWDDSKVSKDSAYIKAQQIFILSRPERKLNNVQEWIRQLRPENQDAVSELAKKVKNKELTEQEFEEKVKTLR